jgi:hypothetical protein
MSIKREVVQKMIVTYLTTMTSIGDFKARGPEFIREMSGWARPLSGGLSLGFYPIKCSLGLSYYAQTWGTISLPLVLVLSYAFLDYIRVKRSQDEASFFTDIWACCVVVLYFMYPSAVQMLLSGNAPIIVLHVILYAFYAYSVSLHSVVLLQLSSAILRRWKDYIICRKTLHSIASRPHMSHPWWLRLSCCCCMGWVFLF